MLTGPGPHLHHHEHLWTDKALELIFHVGNGHRELLRYSECWVERVVVTAGAHVAKEALNLTP